LQAIKTGVLFFLKSKEPPVVFILEELCCQSPYSGSSSPLHWSFLEWILPRNAVGAPANCFKKKEMTKHESDVTNSLTKR
jgi:hypothetical protein